MRRAGRRMLLSCVLALAGQTAAATIGFDIEPDPVVLNESCTLTFRALGEVDGEPDFAPLEPYFDIIGRNRQTSVNWTNGRHEQSTVWVLSAMPRKAGRHELPAIAFGSDTTIARSVEVVAAPRTRADSGADILLEVEADPPTPYVQQQVIYTVRLLHRVELSSSRFSALTTTSDAIVKPLGNGRQYIEQVKGVSYDAYEQRYAVFPQHSGELTINPIVLTTQVVTGTRGFFDPFAQSMTTRRVESDALSLNVKPVPATYPAGATWLPARRLRLHEEWEPDVNSIEAGAPLARTLFLWADGLIAGQLPTLEMAPPDGVKLYPDQAQSNEQDTASGFTAVLQRKFAVIASHGGEVRFAAMAVPWWNIESDSLEYARLPERALSVAGPPAAAPVAPGPQPVPEDPAPAADPATPGPPAMSSEIPAFWPALCAALAGAWALTVFAWWRSRARHLPAAPPPSAREVTASRARRSLAEACRAGDARAAAAALREWAAATLPAGKTHLSGVAAAGPPALAAAVRELEQNLYGPSRSPWQGAALWQAFEQATAAREAPTRSADPLPPLFRLVDQGPGRAVGGERAG